VGENAQVVGTFLGFSEGGLEFHADLILPYRNDFQSLPMHGQFVLVALENDDEAVFGANHDNRSSRSADLRSGGRLRDPAAAREPPCSRGLA